MDKLTYLTSLLLLDEKRMSYLTNHPQVVSEVFDFLKESLENIDIIERGRPTIPFVETITAAMMSIDVAIAGLITNGSKTAPTTTHWNVIKAYLAIYPEGTDLSVFKTLWNDMDEEWEVEESNRCSSSVSIHCWVMLNIINDGFMGAPDEGENIKNPHARQLHEDSVKKRFNLNILEDEQWYQDFPSEFKQGPNKLI